MRRPSPFNFDISASADKKRRARGRGLAGGVETGRVCDKPGCERPGRFRAPRSPEQLDDFFWFCLDHVREYNLKWNFFQDQSDADLERQFAADRVWDRPTRPFSETVAGRGATPHAEGRAWQRFGFDDPLEVLGDKGTLNPGVERAAPARPQRRLPPTERRALEILDAQDTQSKTEIRKIYKALVKDLHPDMNAGKRDDEARLTEVVWAWEQIKASRSFPD
jgi:DnaJ-domain-containing protein 1